MLGPKKLELENQSSVFFQFFGPEDGEYDEGLAYFLV